MAKKLRFYNFVENRNKSKVTMSPATLIALREMQAVGTLSEAVEMCDQCRARETKKTPPWMNRVLSQI